MTQPETTLVYVGLYRIGRAIGVGKNMAKYLIEHEGLPAWRDGNSWRALPEDLKAWLCERRKKAATG